MIGVSEEELKRDGKEMKEFINNSRFPSEMFDCTWIWGTKLRINERIYENVKDVLEKKAVKANMELFHKSYRWRISSKRCSESATMFAIF